MTPQLLVIAKAPIAGRAKTRLCPPCTPDQAAALAAAALADTLDAATATPAARHLLVLDGPVGEWLPEGWAVTTQHGDGLDERLAAAFEQAGGPALVIGMDTPQVTPAILAAAMATLRSPDVDAVVGPASDGGYWAIGLERPDPAVFLGIAMSTGATAQAQCERLDQLGLRWRELAVLRDVDGIEDARAVAALRREGRFARTLSGMGLPPLAAAG